MSVSETVSTPTRQETPRVPGPPLLGSALAMAKDPAQFFYDCYRKYGPVFRMNVLTQEYIVLAGPDAATFMSSRDGKECLRSKEFWQGLLDEFGATRSLTSLDGEPHKKMRDILRHGYSRESIKGRYNELIKITDGSIERDWKTGEKVPVVESFQYMVTDQLGTIITGSAPLEYMKAIRTTILYILNVLITRQRPKFYLWNPAYQLAKRKTFELGHKMIADWRARGKPRNPDQRTNTDDIMEANLKDPDFMTEQNLPLMVVAPYVAGLDTVANTTAAITYAVLKEPGLLEKVQAEVDELFKDGEIEEERLLQRMPVLNGAIMETMRLYPIAVAQMRTANKDFEFHGHAVREGQMVYMATCVAHFMEEFYPEPMKFDHTRYEKPRAEHLQPGAYSPYGRGPHTCLGKSLAEIQLALSMARLFYRLDLELESPDYVLKTKTAPTPGPAMSFKVRVKGYRN